MECRQQEEPDAGNKLQVLIHNSLDSQSRHSLGLHATLNEI